MTPGRTPVPGRRLVVLASGVSWDDTMLSEKQLALHLAAHVPILFVDPPMSWLTPLRKPQLARSVTAPRLRTVAPNILRLTPLAPPGISRPGLRALAFAAQRRAVGRAVRALRAQVAALVVCSLDPLFPACPAEKKVLYGTDDWVSGAELMNLSTGWLQQRERAQLAAADLVVTVSDTLAARWRDRAAQIVVIPNGCDADAFAAADSLPRPTDVTLPDPIAGFVGHLSERIDLDALTAVAQTGRSLLLVGPRQLTFDIDRVEALLRRPNVQWVGAKDFAALPGYLGRMKVGLTPYADTAFNRSSFPLKTLEYLAAGRPAVMTDLPAARSLPDWAVTRADGPAAFAAAVVAALDADPDEAAAARRRDYAQRHSWAARAREFAQALGLTPDAASAE